MKRFRTLDCIAGQEVKICGFVHSIRDHGELLFLEIRDHVGIIQIVIEQPKKLHSISLESVITVTGKVRNREQNENPNLPTGKIEISAKESDIIIHSSASVLPFLPEDSVSEALQYQYRPLYLRSFKMQRIIQTRAKLYVELINLMSSLGFTYIETPLLTSSSPEGARDFIVPSRLYPGKCYALPQSPQIFKQLCMVAGFNSYFQIADCFRDEDPRKDRCYGSFKQLDLECSFATEKDIQNILWNVFEKIISKFASNKILKTLTLTYDEALEKYGSDKPDLRNPLYLEDWSNYFMQSEMDLFRNMVAAGGKVKAIRCDNVTAHRSILENIEKAYKFKIAYITKQNGTYFGPIGKFMTDSNLLKEGETLFFVANNNAEVVYKNSDKLIRYLGEHLKLVNENLMYLVLIKDFPFFEMNDGKIGFSHNPFSKPQRIDWNNLIATKAYQYDFVLNGYELGSGSERNTDVELLKKLFETCGYDNFETHFPALKMFKYGVPPHAGFAFGLDRLLMILMDLDSVRDTQAFPLSPGGADPLMGCPNTLNEQQLKELKIKFDIKGK